MIWPSVDTNPKFAKTFAIAIEAICLLALLDHVPEMDEIKGLLDCFTKEKK